MNCPSRFSATPRGFALIITISLLVLLSLIAVGLLSLSAISVRTASRGSLQAEARQNARLALQLAVGDLQKLAGPDRRITARADILDEAEDSTLASPSWTGVWESWKWDGEGKSPDYESEKSRRFLGWLASHPDPEALEDILAAEGGSSEADDFLLFGGKSREPLEEGDQVRALQVDVQSRPGPKGSYAWAVFDEGQKARFLLPKHEPEERSQELAELTAPGSPSFRDLERLGPLDALDNDTREKLLDLSQLDLVGIDDSAKYFHDLTPYSMSLLTDVVNGGFARDLSLAFDGTTLPSDYATRFIYSDTDTPLVGAPDRFRGANPLPSPDPSWRLLHSHYRLYREIRDASGAPTLTATFDVRPPAGTNPARVVNHPSFHKQNIAPVIAKAQFIFSLSAGWHGHLNTLRRRGAATPNDKYISWLVIDPVITLWNPYNVALRFSESRIDLYRVPLAFRLYKNGKLVNREYTHFANTFLGGDTGSRANRYYRLNIKPKKGEYEVVMQPGEFMVFSAHNHVKHFRHEYSTRGVDLRPGFNAPAGNSSNEYVGGISTLNVCVNSRGGDSGRINGKNVRSLPLKANDIIQVDVKPMRARIDRVTEAGGKEVTAFLKYARSNSSRGGNLIGGIELDYGDKEDEFLESYPTRDLPTFIVPAEIPERLKADDYQGRKPPPACRFKEPFLIASLQLKTEQDAKFPSKGWINNAPANLYASAGLDQEEDFSAHQYEFVWEPMTDWTSSPTIEIDAEDRGFGASGIYAQTGREFAPFRGVPLVPLTSLAEFRHAPLNHGGQLPLTTQIVGNSFASSLIPRDKVRVPAGSRTYLDHSFLANTRLFDHHFLSTATTRDTALHGPKRNLKETLSGFFSDGEKLPNRRFRAYQSANADPDALVSTLESATGYREMGAHLLLDGGFNVNSTSVDAWRAFLSSISREELPLLDAITGRLGSTRGEGSAFSRFAPPAQRNLESANKPDTREMLKWAGHRRLDKYEIERLAWAIVEQVKRRGPFQSVAEFVNRRAENSDEGLRGALQAAIDEAKLNEVFRNDWSVSVLPAPGVFADPDAAKGLTAEGAPAFLNQADLLVPMAPFITVRSDTFRIRAMGAARNGGDQPIRAVCEAIVQRVPEYLDQTDDPATPVADLEPSGVNARFGRRFRIVSFRWLSNAEL